MERRGNMARYLLRLLMVISVCCVVSSCGKSTDETKIPEKVNPNTTSASSPLVTVQPTAQIPISSSNEADKQLEEGIRQFNSGSYENAIDAYNKALALMPDLVEGYINRGVAYHQKGWLDKALADFDKALTLNANLAEAYFFRARTYNVQGNIRQAVSDYTDAIRLNGGLAEAYFNRAACYWKLQDFDRAVQDGEVFIKRFPEHAMVPQMSKQLQGWKSLNYAYNNHKKLDSDEAKRLQAICSGDIFTLFQNEITAETELEKKVFLSSAKGQELTQQINKMKQEILNIDYKVEPDKKLTNYNIEAQGFLVSLGWKFPEGDNYDRGGANEPHDVFDGIYFGSILPISEEWKIGGFLSYAWIIQVPEEKALVIEKIAKNNTKNIGISLSFRLSGKVIKRIKRFGISFGGRYQLPVPEVSLYPEVKDVTVFLYDTRSGETLFEKAYPNK
jgi:tetratricopeptide (TPR) repeat protein